MFWPEVELKKDTNSKVEWNTVQNGGVYAASTESGVTGFGAGSVESTPELLRHKSAGHPQNDATGQKQHDVTEMVSEVCKHKLVGTFCKNKLVRKYTSTSS